MIFLLSIIVTLQFCTRLSAWRSQIAVWAAGVVLGLSVWLFLPYAWENSRITLEQKVSSGAWADNLTLLVSLDVLLGLYWAYRVFRKEFGYAGKHEWVHFFPSLLLFPAIFWLSAEMFYALPGLSYTQTGLLLSLMFTLGVPLIGYFLKWFFMKNTAIAEFQVVVNVVLMATMIAQPLLTASKPTHQEPVHWGALGVIAVVCLVGFLLGIFIQKIIKRIMNAKTLRR